MMIKKLTIIGIAIIIIAIPIMMLLMIRVMITVMRTMTVVIWVQGEFVKSIDTVITIFNVFHHHHHLIRQRERPKAYMYHSCIPK